MDHLASQLYGHMVRDFQMLLGDQDFGQKALDALSISPKRFREYVFPTLGEVPPYRFKAWWQLANFLKRYRFEHDAYTDDELAERTSSAFIATQNRLATVGHWTVSVRMVLCEARKVCKSILDEPFATEAYRRFGKRATINCKLDDAFLDHKLSNGHIFTCPTPLLEGFKTFVRDTSLGSRMYTCLRNTKRKGKSKVLYTMADNLALVQVPKSWKSNRGITPLSEFGLYWSHGIGGYVEHCLRKHGLDIKRAEARHRALARKYSISRSHVTGDLSDASNSILRPVLNAILPRRVYTELRKTFVPSVVVDGRNVYSMTCLPMGNGATFPIETLVFYCLIKAIGNLLEVKGTYSVYGDDLIYPSKIHTYVYQIFGQLGIKFNLEKTFRLSHFRESCGGDYYHGIDVRPALFPEREDVCAGKQELQFLYKVWNALRERWTRIELKSTFHFLEMEIFVKSFGKVLFVPKSFPPTAGYRVSRPPKLPWFFQETVKVGFEHGTQVYQFKCILNGAPPQREIIDSSLYMLASLDSLQRLVPPQADLLSRNLRLIRRIQSPYVRFPDKTCPLKGKITVLSKRRYDPSVLKWVVRRFLKTTAFGSGECGGVFPTTESLHKTGLPRMKRVKVFTWT